MVHYVPSLLVIVLPPSDEVYSFILEVESYPSQAFALATSAGLLWLGHSRSDLRRPFKVWSTVVILRIALGLARCTFLPVRERQRHGFVARDVRRCRRECVSTTSMFRIIMIDFLMQNFIRCCILVCVAQAFP
jgi:hypothetical protein